MDASAYDNWLCEPFSGNSHHVDRQISEVEFTRLADQHHNAGYRDGIQKGKQLSIQEGFDKGFEVGAKWGKSLGLLRGRASATLEILLKRNGAEDARVGRIKELIIELNQLGQFQDSRLSTDRDQIEGLANQMNGLMDLTSPKIRPCHSTIESSKNDHLQQEVQATLDRYHSELNAILSTMNIWLQSP